ncbi:MAG: hypothetical protein Kow00109_24790 [Acidobacteriota bacterium]
MSQTPAVSAAQLVGSQPKGQGPAGKGGGDFATKFLDLLFAEGEAPAAAKRNAPARQQDERAQHGNAATTGEGEAAARLPKGEGPADSPAAKGEGTDREGKKPGPKVPSLLGETEAPEPNAVGLALDGVLQLVQRSVAAGRAGSSPSGSASHRGDLGPGAPDGAARQPVTPERIAKTPHGGKVAVRGDAARQLGVDSSLAGASVKAASPIVVAKNPSAVAAGTIRPGEPVVAQLARRLWGVGEVRAATEQDAALGTREEVGGGNGHGSSSPVESLSPGDTARATAPAVGEAGHLSGLRERLQSLFSRSLAVSPAVPEGSSTSRVARPAERRGERAETIHGDPAAGSERTGRRGFSGTRGDNNDTPGDFGRQVVAPESGEGGDESRGGEKLTPGSSGQSRTNGIRGTASGVPDRRATAHSKAVSGQGRGEEITGSAMPQGREPLVVSTPSGGPSGIGSPKPWQPIANQTFRPEGAGVPGGEANGAPEEIEAASGGEGFRKRLGALRRDRSEGMELKPDGAHVETEGVTGQQKSQHHGRAEGPAGRAEVTDSMASPGASAGTRTAAPSRSQAAPVLSEALTQQVFQQLVQRVRLDRWPEVEQLTVQLRPELLGKVVIETRQERGEHLHAVIKVEDPAVKQLFDQRLPELLEKLAESGIQVDSAEVDWLGGGNADSQSGHRNASPAMKGAELTAEEELQSSDPFAGVAEDGRKSWFA